MKHIYTLLSVLIFLLLPATDIAQDASKSSNATFIQKASYMVKIPSIASQVANGKFIPADTTAGEVNPKHRDGNRVIPGKGLPKGNDPLWNPYKASAGIKNTGPILTFQAASSNTTPTDPTGAVGPDHFVNSWNSSFRIWDKEGNALTDAASLATIFPGETLGDPIVLYDQLADRFLITELTFQIGFLVAISQGPDPVNDGWYTYFFQVSSLPDYPKYSLWSDGYYITANKDSWSAGTSEVVFALERDKLLEGDPEALMVGFPLPDIETSGFYSPLGFNVCGQDAPPAGGTPIVYMQDDSWSGVSTDHLKIWTIDTDWDDPSSSSISEAQEIEVTPFDGVFDGGSFSNLPQPSGQDIDALQATIMNLAQYRRFPTHNSVVFNFVVDLDGSDDYAGIRWYELRQEQDGDPWEIYQEGTYSQPDGHSTFCGTMAMDALGNIGMAYTVVSELQYPSIRYTGRYETDPLNEMSIEEQSIAEGTVQDPSSRYGDYAQMTVDPEDDKTFWAISEYFNGGPRKNQVGVFKIAPDLANDVGISNIDGPVNGALSENEPVSVSIRNYGIESQSDIPVSYQVDGGEAVSEVYEGSVEPGEIVQFTFSNPADLGTAGTTYEIKAFTSMTTDENTINDSISTWVTHLYDNDLGITEVIGPESGEGLSNVEPVSVVIRNFGANPQSDFEVSYLLDGNDPVTEEVPGPLESETSIEYTFLAPGNFAVPTDHQLFATTSHPDDGDPSNDSVSVTVTNTLCQPDLICEYGVGIFTLKLAEIENNSGCDPEGYGDYTNLTATLEVGSVNDLTISTEYGKVFVKAWIDLNDNFVLENSEVVVNDYEIAPGQGTGSFTETMPLVIPEDAQTGEHFMRFKANYNAPVPDDPCEETLFGETEDYIAIIEDATGTTTSLASTTELILANKGSNRFQVLYEDPALNGSLVITVHNVQGQMVVYNRVMPVNGTYLYELDMSHAPRGIYLVRLGSESFGRIKRIMVE